jgi:magnesium-transporting ATPase (P-type)
MLEKIIVPEQYWSRSLESVLATLGSTADGLQAADAQQRQETFGPNVLAIKERATALGLFLNQFKSPITRPRINSAPVGF